MIKFRDTKFWKNYLQFESISNDSSMRGFVDATLLWKLLTHYPKRNILEIGCYQGLTTGLFFECNPQSCVTSIDIKDRLDLFRKNYNQYLPQHQFYQMKSQEFDCKDKKYDIVFIDGDHSHETSWMDMQLAMKCITPDGILIIDDYNMSGVKQSIKNLYVSYQDWVPFMQGIQTQFWHHKSQNKSEFLDGLLQDPLSNILLMNNIKDHRENIILQAQCVRALSDHYNLFDTACTLYSI